MAAPRSTLAHREGSFVDDIRTIERRREPRAEKNARIRARCAAEIGFLKHGAYTPVRGRVVGELETYDGYAPTTVRRAITRYRNALREAFGSDHVSLTYMKLPQKQQKALNAEYAATIFKQHHALRPIDPDELVAVARRLIALPYDEPALSVAAGLFLPTGRRPIEIMVTGDFERVSKDRLVFSGQAKRTKHGYDTPEAQPYEIPVLVDAGDVLKAFYAVRERYTDTKLAGKTDEEASSTFRKWLGDYAKRSFFDDVSPKPNALSPKELRAAYATIAYEWYAPRNITANAFFSRILGHSIGDLETSFSYQKFYNRRSKRKFERAFRESAEELLSYLEQHRCAATDDKIALYDAEKIAKVKALLKHL